MYTRRGFALLLALGALGACGKDDKHGTGSAATSGSGSAAARKLTLTLDWVPEPEFGGFYAARESGAFARQGLDVDIKPRGQGQTWKLVNEGVTDIATTAADQVLVAREAGADVVALFAVYQTAPAAIMVHKARGFTQIGDVFTNPGTLEAEDVAWLKFLRAKYPDAKVTLTSNSPGIATFLAKPELSKQCFITSEPLQATAAGSDPQTVLVADAGYNPYTTVVIARGELVRKEPETVKKLIAALREGWRGYLDDPASANAVMGKLNREMDAATMAQVAKIQAPLIETAETKATALGEMTSARWQTLGQQLVDLKVLTKAPPADECFTSLARLGAAH
jgi:NitT/TauT family transport system substrate-binding protein